jgi:hypothetical protein
MGILGFCSERRKVHPLASIPDGKHQKMGIFRRNGKLASGGKVCGNLLSGLEMPIHVRQGEIHAAPPRHSRELADGLQPGDLGRLGVVLFEDVSPAQSANKLLICPATIGGKGRHLAPIYSKAPPVVNQRGARDV